MSLNINTNLTALRASNSLQAHYSNLSTSIQRLSSGVRINSSVDDPEGYAISNILRGKIATLGQGIKNTNEAISLIQTAESSLNTIEESLVRMKELAEQAATGTYTQEQRAMIQSEFISLTSEIDRIANSTNYKDIKLLTGDLSGNRYSQRINQWHLTDYAVKDVADLDSTQKGLKIHFGDSNLKSQDYYFIKIDNMTTGGLFGTLGQTQTLSQILAVSTQHSAQLALQQINSAMQYKDINRSHLGAMQNRLEITLKNLENQVDNTEAADSNITDIDVAIEMADFMKSQVLAEAATSMLAQANSLPKLVLKLLSA